MKKCLNYKKTAMIALSVACTMTLFGGKEASEEKCSSERPNQQLKCSFVTMDKQLVNNYGRVNEDSDKREIGRELVYYPCSRRIIEHIYYAKKSSTLTDENDYCP